ncbi:outer membrane beta-barrel family protein [uncultured Maribacter sp.]|uniref:outer membrane beta-barrel protein n=1 Tax=uncultured Maribacter sp. TaxID=431308 RepID=UPI002611CDD9|nr:outer membrane beta-barrel family protein [uncultured Maribacter sp.]
MIKLYSSLFFIFFYCITSFAQEYTVSGTVLDGNKIPISYATVVVKRLDSVLIKGTSTSEDGTFKIEEIKRGKYYLQASYIGNTSKLIPVQIDKNITVENISLLLQDQNLDEVVVTLQKPRLERKADRLVFNIANTALTDSDIWDVLKKTPSVLISGEKLQIKGQDNIGVMINNKKVNLPTEDLYNLLSGTSANNVESIEVITNPPIKYSAEGGMLINIVMHKNLASGYNGSLYNTYKQGIFAKHTLGTDHYFKGDKTDFSVNYSFSRNKKITRYTDKTSYLGTPSSDWTANQNSTRNENKHNINLFFDYFINKKNTLSLSSLNVLTPNYSALNNTDTNINFADITLDSSFKSLIFSDRNYLNTAYYADWIRKLKKEGAEVSFGSHYTFYKSEIGQDLNTTFFNNLGSSTGVNNFTTDSNQKINLYNAQIDFVTPVGESSRVEAGIRYAGIDSESTIRQEGYDRNQPGINPTDAGVFLYNEDIYAGYTSFNASWEKFKFNTGLRIEYTETVGDLDTSPSKTENNYLELFPSFSLNFVPNKNNGVRLYYFRRINRPRYNKINPFQYFESNNSVIEGNPNLLPATRNYIALEYTLKKAYSIAISYRAEKNYFSEQVFQDNASNLLRYLSYNIDRNISYGVDFTMNKNITNFWDTYALIYISNKENEFVDFNSGDLLSRNIWMWMFRTRNSFTLLDDKSIMADVDYEYYSPTIYGNESSDASSNLSITIRKTLWNKKASISLGMSDIFRKDIYFASRVYGDQNNSTFTRRENRLFTLGFRYKFGNEKIKANKKSKNNAERGRI